MLERVSVAIETVCLGLWAGAMAAFAFIVAPIAFRTMPGMDLFAALTGAVIKGVGTFGSVCGGLAIVAGALRASAAPARKLGLLRVGLVAIALGASAYQTNAILPSMNAISAQIHGPIDSVPRADPRRAAYDGEHKASTRVYGTAFICVIGALALSAFGRRAVG